MDQATLNKQFETMHSLRKLQCDGSLGLCFDALSPELQFGVNGAMKHKILLEALGMKGADRRMMADLLRHPLEAQIISNGDTKTITILNQSLVNCRLIMIDYN